MDNIYGKVSKSPTITNKKTKKTSFDVADLYKGPVDNGLSVEGNLTSLDEKLRKAYFWITNYAIITPFYDIEFYDGSSKEFRIGDKKTTFRLPSGQSYSSFILLPLLNLAVKKRCLLIGGPGRGKTASAMLMGLIAGYSMKEIKRSIQHGQPQMTISDLLGNPIPSDLMNAKNMDDIKIAWRKWLGMTVKIIDEYNRIPTRTQSALLTVMGDNYAEILDQIYECPESAWYLTANDDAGGGTYQVIEALRDRIDVVVRSLHFNTRFVGELLTRIESGTKPEEMIPQEIIFTHAELEKMRKDILSVEIPDTLMRRIEYFASQFELFESGGEQLEYKTKDNVKLAGMDINDLMSGETGKDRLKDIGNQTKNGFSVRTLMTCLVFIKAMAYFRGENTVTGDDIIQVLPFVLHDKLVMNTDSPFFEQPENSIYRVDKISWIRKLFDMSNREFDRLGMEKNDPVGDLLAEFTKGLEGLPEKDTRERIISIERVIEDLCKGRKVYGPLYDDILTLKYLHQRYTNYLKWLLWKQ
jgi:MoxR-like ATPase